MGLKSLVSGILAIGFWLGGLSVLLVGVMLYLPLTSFLPPRRFDGLIRVICRGILLGSGQWLRVEGPRPDPSEGPFIYIFNHASLFDAFMLMAVLPSPISGIGAQKQFTWPIWSTLLRRFDMIPIERDKLGSAIASMKASEKVLARGTSLIISPEGTRTSDGQLQPFKKGAFHVAINSGATILPMGLHRTFRAKAKNDWRIRAGVLTLRFGSPISRLDYAGKTVDELRDLSRARVVDLLQ